MITRRLTLTTAYTALGCALIGAYFAAPAGSDLAHLLYELVALSGLAAVYMGLRRHKPKGATWRLIFLGLALWAGGDSYWNAYRWVTGHEAPFPSYADGLYLVCYIPLIIGVLGFVRGGRPRISDLIDGGILGVAASLVVWFAVLEPVSGAGSSHLLPRIIASAYPVADNLLLLVLVQLVIARQLRPPALRYLTAAFAVILATDLIYARARVDATYTAGSWIDLGYLLFYVLLACGFLSPSMSELLPAPDQPGREVSKLRLASLSIALLIAPAFVALGTQADTAAGAAVLGVGAAIIGLLVLARLILLFREREAIDQQRLQAQAELAAMAYRDPLTEVANRSALYEAADAAVSEARAAGQALAILFVDLDRFKTVNDRYGHLDGDQVLHEAAKRLRAAVREADLVARHGGDEFVIMLRALHTDEAEQGTTAVIARISKQFAKPFSIASGTVEIGVSVGFSLYPRDGSSARELIESADKAMYQQKVDHPSLVASQQLAS